MEINSQVSTEKKKNMALRREPDKSKRRQLDTFAQRRWRAFSRVES